MDNHKKNMQLTISDVIRRRGGVRRVVGGGADERVMIRVPQSREVLMEALVDQLGGRAQWLPEYEEVADWLGDNHGQGLMCIGNCGRGKSLLTQVVLPRIINRCCRLVVNCYTAHDLNRYNRDERDRTHLVYDDIRQYKLISIDDLGTETQEAVIYGERYRFFPRLADEAERRQKLLLLSTNLTVQQLFGDDGQPGFYDLRTKDRIGALCRRVYFVGSSLRGL